ncbi:MAG TPA: hypothetical protein VIZ63_21765 [Povalibacter sp.]
MQRISDHPAFDAANAYLHHQPDHRRDVSAMPAKSEKLVIHAMYSMDPPEVIAQMFGKWPQGYAHGVRARRKSESL